MKAILSNKYVLDLVHLAVLVLPFVVLQIPANVLNLTIGGVIGLVLTYLKSLVVA